MRRTKAARGSAAMSALAAMICLLGVPAGADRDDLTGGVLVTHNIPGGISYSTDPPTGGWCGYYAEHAIATLAQVNARLPFDPEGTLWFVLAAWETEGGTEREPGGEPGGGAGGEPEDRTWCGTEFGLGDYDDVLYTILDCDPCFPGTGLEIPVCCWPGPNEGTAFVTIDTPWSGNWVPVYWFGGYAYDASYGATIVQIDVDPPTGFCGFSNCQSPPSSFFVSPDQRGGMGVNTPGVVPVWPTNPPLGACCVDDICRMLTEGDCQWMRGVFQGAGTTCDPDPCGSPTPVDESTWGRIKGMYR